MPPHCDTMDGPVVKAAIKALETGNVNYILPWVPESSEDELRKAFSIAVRVGEQGREAKELSDYWLFETAVRLHREGEGAGYSGLKPAGLDWGPVVPRAEKAIETGDGEDAIDFVVNTLRGELRRRFNDAMSKREYDVDDVGAARQYVAAYLSFVLFSHNVYAYIKKGGGHGEAAEGAAEGGREH